MKKFKRIYMFYLLPFVLLVHGCGVEELKKMIKIDKHAPILSMSHSLDSLDKNHKPATFTFSASEAGKILYESGCQGREEHAKKGLNTISFSHLSDGLYDFCTVSVMDEKNNASAVLHIPDFMIKNSAVPVLEEVVPIENISSNHQSRWVFRSSAKGKIHYFGPCHSMLQKAKTGLNSVTLDSLEDGFYDTCRIEVEDEEGMISASLKIGAFKIDTAYQSALKQTIVPKRMATLDSLISESSGLLRIDGRYFTHNDSGHEAVLYEIDLFGNILRKIKIEHAKNIDWEDITQDESNVYIADIGNNAGTRKDLAIYKISKEDLLNKKQVTAEKIAFSYRDQTSFTAAYFATPYDGEAVINYHDKLYIFTKNWVDRQSNIYALSKEAGRYVLDVADSLSLDFLISGADFDEISQRLVLVGYETLSAQKQHIVIAEDFRDGHFSSGHFQTLHLASVPRGFRQIEGVAFASENHLMITSETLNHRLIGNHPGSLFSVDITR